MQEIYATNVPKILDLKSSSEQRFSENWRWVPLSDYDTDIPTLVFNVATEYAIYY